MKEYAKKPESQSRTLDSNPKASTQAPIDVILQRYKQNIQRYASAEEEEPLQGKFDTMQREGKTNNTGLPDNLKTGIENVSGYSLDDVKVHYNSDKPAQLNALAYAQGTDIHVASGQEKHLPHEAWHVVQQKQGRVRPTMQLQGVNINDSEGLEKEADVMGEKVLLASNNPTYSDKLIINSQMTKTNQLQQSKSPQTSIGSIQHHQAMKQLDVLISPIIQRKRVSLAQDKLNVAGEDHAISAPKRDKERKASKDMTGGDYWKEDEFRTTTATWWDRVGIDKRARADSLLNRYDQALSFIIENNSLDNKSWNVKSITIQTRFAQDLSCYIYNLDSTLITKDQTDGFELTAQQRNALLQLKGLTTLLNDAANKMKINEPNTLTDFKTATDNLKRERENKDTILGSLDNSSTISKRRSEDMHRVANQMYTEIGVWKIGKKHWSDLDTKNPKKYNLISQTDFDDTINALP